MKRSIYFFFLLIQACSIDSNNSNIIIGNWAYLDYELNVDDPYTEVYFNDTSYVIKNSLIGTVAHRYILHSDTLFRFDCIEKGCLKDSDINWTSVGNISSFKQDQINLNSSSGLLVMSKLDDETLGFFDYYSSDSLKFDWQIFTEDFHERAIEYYIANDIFKSKEEYYESLETKATRTINDDFDVLDTAYHEQYIEQ